jgi:hypothetical protein
MTTRAAANACATLMHKGSMLTRIMCIEFVSIWFELCIGLQPIFFVTVDVHGAASSLVATVLCGRSYGPMTVCQGNALKPPVSGRSCPWTGWQLAPLGAS